MTSTLLFLVLHAAAPTPPLPVVVPPLPGFTCTNRSLKNDQLDMTEVRCTQNNGAIILEARLYTVVTTQPPEVDVLCKADLKRNHAMTFDAFEKADASVVTVHGAPACRVDIVGTHGTTGGPWRLAELTSSLKTRWLALTAQGPVGAMTSQQALVERFLADTAAK